LAFYLNMSLYDRLHSVASIVKSEVKIMKRGHFYVIIFYVIIFSVIFLCYHFFRYHFYFIIFVIIFCYHFLFPKT